MTDRAIIYCRQSLTRDEDDSLSLDFQERECRLYAAKHGMAVIDPVISDPDVKGWDPLRPGIAELLKRLESDRADVVVVYAMSRFARDYILQETIWRQIRERGARLISVHEPHAEDDLVRGIIGVVSQAERRRMGAFLSSSFRERARRGLPHGKTPFGFAKDPSGRLVVNDDARHHVVAIVEKLEAGWSLWKVARWLNETHVDGRSWEPNVVRNTVKTPAIAGGVKCADVITWDAHEPIVDRDRWHRLVELLDTRRPTRTKQSYSWLEGIIFCGCGAPMHLITDRFNTKEPAGRFRCSADPSREQFQRPRQFPPCSHSPRSIAQHKAETGTINVLTDDLASLLDWREVQRSLELQFRSHESDAGKRRKSLERDLGKLEGERDRLLVLYRRGTLDVERWEAEDLSIARSLTDVKTELEALPANPDPDRTRSISDQLQGVRAAIERVAIEDPSQIRTILMQTDASVTLTPDGMRVRWPADLQQFVATTPTAVV